MCETEDDLTMQKLSTADHTCAKVTFQQRVKPVKMRRCTRIPTEDQEGL